MKQKIFSVITAILLVVSCSKKESCSDGIKNQNETAIDCGGVCSPCLANPNNPNSPSDKITLHHKVYLCLDTTAMGFQNCNGGYYSTFTFFSIDENNNEKFNQEKSFRTERLIWWGEEAQGLLTIPEIKENIYPYCYNSKGLIMDTTVVALFSDRVVFNTSRDVICNGPSSYGGEGTSTNVIYEFDNLIEGCINGSDAGTSRCITKISGSEYLIENFYSIIAW